MVDQRAFQVEKVVEPHADAFLHDLEELVPVDRRVCMLHSMHEMSRVGIPTKNNEK